MRALWALVLLCTALFACRDPALHEPVSGGAPSASAGRARATPSASSEREELDEDAAPRALAIGKTVAVKAKNALGAPLHPAPGDSAVSGRLADGSRVRIEAVAQGGRWYEVTQPPLRGWLTRRYLESEAAAAAEAPAALDPRSPFASAEACRAALANGSRQARQPGRARIGSWNLHWFPDGKPGRGEDAEGRGVDLPWLACVITWLDLDALAVQEIKTTERARRKLDELLVLLSGQDRGSWRAALDDCPEHHGQHVGVLYDSRRAKEQGRATIAALNPHGSPCQDQLRPGFELYLRFRGGLDLHVVSAHLKAGGKRRDFELRRRSFEMFAEAQAAAQKVAPDGDVLVMGDLNTMGCPDCSPPIAASSEIDGLAQLLAGEGFRRVESDHACTLYFGREASLLDGATAALGFDELGPGAEVNVSGACAELGCRVPRGKLLVNERLSDHCPIYLDVEDRDRDP